MDPTQKKEHLFSGFIQNEISLANDAVKLTLGSKIEHNDYSHMEIQPNLELSVVGQNLLRGDHVEYVQESFSAPVEEGLRLIAN